MEQMMQQEILLWGCGERGGMALERFPWLPLRAAIDSDPAKQGRLWHGVPVISKETYLEQYAELPVLVTPGQSDDITVFLEEHGRHHYWILRELLRERQSFFRNNETEADAAWVEQKWRLVAAAAEADVFRWRDIAKAYFEHHFLNQAHRKTREEMLCLLKEAKHPFLTVDAPSICAPFQELCTAKIEFHATGDLPEVTDLLLIHGLSVGERDVQLAMQAEARGIPVLFTEDGFLRSIEPFDGNDLRYTAAHAVQLDMGGLYIHADGPSLLEDSMNSDKVLDAAELARVRGLIARIRREKLSKYNHQRITGQQLGTPGREKVLVIDQVYGDKSIAYGWATDATFLEMYHLAVEENPEADIFVKAHPVASKGHFASVQAGGRIHVLTEPMNPIELVEQMDKVYVCTSQLGFEAAFCGKEVHTFGMPFYAGWGFTIDAKHHPRRRKRRTVEEAFYFAYIACNTYISYRTHGVCEIEQAMDELLELRKMYRGKQAADEP